MPRSFFIGVKAFIVDPQRGVLLLNKTKEEGGPYWEVPGGRIDDNESVEETLQRELEEEVPGISDIRPGKLIDMYISNYEYPNKHRIALTYFAASANLPHSITLSAEHSQYRWIGKKDEIPEPCSPVLRHIIEAWQNNSL